MSDDRKSRSARKRLRKDIERAEAMIDAADADGMKLESADIAIVRQAHSVADAGSWVGDWEINFYAATNRISTVVQYPSAPVFRDMKAADELLSHVSFSGVGPDDPDIMALTGARNARIARSWNAGIESTFYAALNRISKRALPVVAATAGREACNGARRAIKIYTVTASLLTLFVVALSCLLFTVNQISDDVRKTVAINDPAAMVLHNQLLSHQSSIIETRLAEEREIRKLIGSAAQVHDRSPEAEEGIMAAREKASSELRALSNSQPALQIKDLLQQFATNNRQLYADVTRTHGIGTTFFLPVDNPYTKKCPPKNETGGTESAIKSAPGATDPARSDWTCSSSSIRRNLEIKVPIMEADHVTDGDGKLLSAEDVVEEGFQKIAVYQDIRAMAIYGREIVLSMVGAVTGFVLPVLYAWLGACAAILRKIQLDTETSTFHPEFSKVANRSHVTCAIIVGIAIGLFSDLVQGGRNISPLAVAFVAGYASDKFFYFVDRLVDVLFPDRTPTKIATSVPSASKAPGGQVTGVSAASGA